jgi:FkbM family methyltransferase
MYFSRISDGCFVEIGAYDGEYASNTSGLADIGWTGYYIEPVPEYYQRCKARHADNNKNITTNQCAIGAESGQVEINVGGPLSTIRNEMRQNFETLCWAKGKFSGEKIQVPQLTLEEYLIKHRVEPLFELLVIDVEGYEWNVLRNFDIQKWYPQMVIVELHDQNNDYLLIREECNNIVRYFDDNGYKVIYKDFSNTIYVPKDSYPLALK